MMTRLAYLRRMAQISRQYAAIRRDNKQSSGAIQLAIKREEGEAKSKLANYYHSQVQKKGRTK